MHKAKALINRPDASAGVAATRPASKTFQFVTANPSSESERSQNKILVRSNASNYHWKRVKKNSDPSASPPIARRRSSTHSQNRSLKRALPLTPQQSVTPSTESDRLTFNDEEESSEPSTASPAQDGEPIILPDNNLTALVISGHHDPFETYPCDLPKEFVSPVLDQVNSFLKLMFPPERGQSVSPLAEEWQRTTFHDRGLFHASLYCQLTRNRVFFSTAAETPEQMQCYTETIRGVHQKFLDLSMRCEDANILSVYALSYHGEPRRDLPEVSPSQGPLTTLQLLHIYGGRLQTVHMHLQGLAKMLTLRGGLSKIKLPGLAKAISFGDIINASQTLTKPILPYVSFHEDVIAPLNAASRKNHPLVGLGRGFRVLPEMLSYEEVSKLLIVVRWIIQYTFAVDDHVKDRPEAQKPSVLLDERNFVQHNLMLLTPEASEPPEEHPVVRLSRLGTVIYSLLVVFPIPAVAAPFHRLSQAVRKELTQASFSVWRREAADLTLWVTVMGAIAAVGTPDRQWYLSTLDHLTRRLGIQNWPSMRERLGMFLWYEYTNDADGLKLWREIEESDMFRQLI